MDRIANHKTSTVDVYDRHGYADEDKRMMAARHVLSLVDGTATSNVISLR